MSYKVAIASRVQRAIAEWKLPDDLLVDVHLNLREKLAESPAQHLVRATIPFEGMVLAWSCVDRANRMLEHFFYFHVLYGQDEQVVEVRSCMHVQRLS